jgi:hypothetical protein
MWRRPLSEIAVNQFKSRLVNSIKRGLTAYYERCNVVGSIRPEITRCDMNTGATKVWLANLGWVENYTDLYETLVSEIRYQMGDGRVELGDGLLPGQTESARFIKFVPDRRQLEEPDDRSTQSPTTYTSTTPSDPSLSRSRSCLVCTVVAAFLILLATSVGLFSYITTLNTMKLL